MQRNRSQREIEKKIGKKIFHFGDSQCIDSQCIWYSEEVSLAMSPDMYHNVESPNVFPI